MSTVRAKVIEGTTGEPLANASVEVVNANGVYLGQGVAADNTGKFAFTSSIIDGNYLLISYQGMTSVIVDTDLLTGSAYTEIELFPKELDTVVVTPKKGSNWFWWLLIGSVIVIASSNKNKKKLAHD